MMHMDFLYAIMEINSSIKTIHIYKEGLCSTKKTERETEDQIDLLICRNDSIGYEKDWGDNYGHQKITTIVTENHCCRLGW